MNLSELRHGDKFRIIKITIGGEIGKRLVDMGLNNGVEGEMLRCALFGDPIEIHIRGYNLSLRRSEAAGVHVEITELGRHQRRQGHALKRGGRLHGFEFGRSFHNQG